MFSDVDGLTEEHQKMIKIGSCINPETAYVQGTDIFNAQRAYLETSFEDLFIKMFYSYKIFDTQDPVKPIKTRIAYLELKRDKFSVFELTLHKLELSDDIYSPFKTSENRSYLNLKEKST